jgi:hypothetical protein
MTREGAMSTVYHLQFGTGAVGPEHVARELHAVMSGGLAEDFEPSTLVEHDVVLVSGLLVNVSAPPWRRRLAITTTIGETTTVVDFKPVAEVMFQPGKAEQLGAFKRYGKFDQWKPQHEDIMLTVLGLLDRVDGDAFFGDDPPWLLRHDGRLLVNELVLWDPPLLGLVPKPITWASITVGDGSHL